jgi:hypothetical protein
MFHNEKGKRYRKLSINPEGAGGSVCCHLVLSFLKGLLELLENK